MAVVNILSSQLTNTYSQPVILSNPYQAGGGDVGKVDVCALGASDSAGSIYRFFRVPSNARLQNLQIQNDANTGGTSYKFGLYKVGVPGSTGGAIAVTNGDVILASAISLASARNIWTEIYFPSILAAGGAVANLKLRLWELLGLTQDPTLEYDLGVAAVTAGTGGGNLAVQASYTL